MGNVTEAVILIAGQGSRLRGLDTALLKPMVPVLGRPLISYTLEGLRSVGIKTIRFVVGYSGERMIAEMRPLIPSGISSSFIENRDWKKQNGMSLLVAAGDVHEPFLLTMGDHLFDDTIYARLLEDFEPTLLNIAIDRKIDSIFDLDDAMKVQTRKIKITAIGKDLREYDGIDIGLFVCPIEIFDYLERARSTSSQNDCSLSDGIRLMAADGKVRAIDIGEGWWQDVDTLGMLRHAEKYLRRRIKAV